MRAFVWFKRTFRSAKWTPMPNGPRERDKLFKCNSLHTTLDQESPGSIPGGATAKARNVNALRAF